MDKTSSAANLTNFNRAPQVVTRSELLLSYAPAGRKKPTSGETSLNLGLIRQRELILD